MDRSRSGLGLPFLLSLLLVLGLWLESRQAFIRPASVLREVNLRKGVFEFPKDGICEAVQVRFGSIVF
jgi:hypothetical protein